MKKVLIFSLAYPPFIGGAEVAIQEITNRISPADFSFDMITLRFDANLPRYEKIGNVAVHRIGFAKKNATINDLAVFPLKLNKYFFPFIAFMKARRLHSQNNYDLIWAMMANYAGFAALFFKLANPRIPFLLTLQEGDPIEYIKKRVRFVYPLFVRIFTKADFVQAISRYLGVFARDMGFAGPLKVVPNAVAIEHFSRAYPQEELDALKRKLGKKKDDIYLITTSRLVKKNGVEDIIAALQFLPKNIKLLIAGIGPLEKDLRFQVSNFKFQDRVLFLGHIGHAELPRYLKISDIFIRPSLSEGMGNSFVEAMVAEIPVIATPVGGIVDFLFDPERNPEYEPTGIFCEVRNPKSIAEKIRYLLEHEEVKKEITANAMRLAREKYDWDIIARDMQHIFETLCAS